MARKPKAPKKSAVGDNSLNPTVLRSVLSKHDGIKEQMASEKGSFMKKMQGLQADLKDCLSEAKKLGIPLKPLKTSINIRDLGRKIVKEQEGLEPEDAKHVGLIIDAMREFEAMMDPTPTLAANDDGVADDLAGGDDSLEA